MALTEEDKNWISTLLDGVRTDMERIETSLRTDMERVETSLLTEFHKWASPLEMRQRSHTATLRALDLELEAVSVRVEKLERRAS